MVTSRSTIHSGPIVTFVLVLLLSLSFGFIALPALTARDDGANFGTVLLWFAFSATTSGSLSSLLMALRPVLTRNRPQTDRRGVYKIAAWAYVVSFAILMPVVFWYLPSRPHWPGRFLFDLWPTLAVHVGFAVGVVLVSRFLAQFGKWVVSSLTRPADADGD